MPVQTPLQGFPFLEPERMSGLFLSFMTPGMQPSSQRRRISPLLFCPSLEIFLLPSIWNSAGGTGTISQRRTQGLAWRSRLRSGQVAAFFTLLGSKTLCKTLIPARRLLKSLYRKKVFSDWSNSYPILFQDRIRQRRLRPDRAFFRTADSILQKANSAS